jgi:hypothetical protein
MRRLVGVVLLLALVAGGVVYFLTTERAVETPAEPVAEVAEAPPPAAALPAPAPSPTPVPAPEPEPEPRVLQPPAPPPPPPVEAELGVLRVGSDVAGAQVFLDRQFVGTTPVVLEDVALGGHQLNVSAEGFDVFAETLDIEPGPRDVYVNFREVRLDVAIAVVHDHRFGSCEGRLVATVDGLRYETDNENDAFDVPLAALERFEVDYLDTNLAVQAGGRTFNFTDPDGDADVLFVFHRDVDDARARLAAGDPPARGE